MNTLEKNYSKNINISILNKTKIKLVFIFYLPLVGPMNNLQFLQSSIDTWAKWSNKYTTQFWKSNVLSIQICEQKLVQKVTDLPQGFEW